MGRLSRPALLGAVGAVAWIVVGVFARPAAAQEPAASYGTSFLAQPAPRVSGIPLTDLAAPCQPNCCTGGSVVLQSMFGKTDPNCWRPLTLSTLFSEGWNEAWVASPNGSGGAPRQGWINAADANLYRLNFVTFAQGFNDSPKANAYQGAYTLLIPLNRRLEIITNIPFILQNNVDSGLAVIDPSGKSVSTPMTHTGFGDISFTPRVLLHETQDFSLTAELAISTPTGTQPLAGNTTRLTPAISFWNNIAGGWVVRGGAAVQFPADGSGDEFIGQLAIGQTVTGHDVPFFGDFTYYLSAVVNTPLANSDQTRVTLTPGMRTHLGHDFYFLAGLPIPVTNARVADLGLVCWFMKAW